MSIIFIDKNKKLCEKVREVFKEHEDYFQQNDLEVRDGDIKEIKQGVFATASNPVFDPAGGLDAILHEKYPKEWEDLEEGVRTKHLFPVISVDSQGHSSREIVKRALVLVFCHEWEDDAFLTGIGTGIGGLSIEDFIEVLEEILSRNLKGIDLSGAYMEGINLSFADLEGANFTHANLRSAKLSDANLRNACLDNADLTEAYLPFSDFENASLVNVNMADAISHSCSYANASLNGACLRYANFQWANFCSAILVSADLSHVELTCCNFVGADLSASNMSGACLTGAVLSRANLDEVNFCGASLKKAIFEGSSVYGTEISEDTRLTGTCFNALTVGEFLEKYKIRRNKDKIKLYKGVSGSYISPCIVGSTKIRYEIGKTYEVELCNFNAGDECGHGLYVCPTKGLAKVYGEKVLQVGVDIKDIVAIPRDGSKVRVKRLKVLEEVNLDSIRE